jgi:ferredoxin
MKNLMVIQKQVHSYWNEQSAILKEKILSSYRSLTKVLDEHKDDDHFTRDFGEFADDVLDTNSLLTSISKVHVKDRLQADRRAGIQKAVKTLESIIKEQFKNLPEPEILEHSWDKEIETLIVLLEKHYTFFCEIFFALRIAEIEHHASFVRFTNLYKRGILYPHQITREEWKLASLFVVYKDFVIKNPLNFSVAFSKLAETSFPVKLVLFEKKVYIPERTLDEEEFVSTQIPTDIALLVPGLQKIHYFQTPFDHKDGVLTERLHHVWKETGASIVRLYIGDPKKDNAKIDRAALGRYIPVFEYNPHLDFNFAKCISIEGNSKPKETWGKETSTSTTPEEREITFADFIYLEKIAPDHFTDPNPNEKRKPSPVAEYLEMDKWNRQHYYPTVIDENGRLKVPSVFLVTISAERAKIWRTIQNWIGVSNPIFDTMVDDLVNKHEKEIETALADQMKRIEEEKTRAVQEAMKNLVINLMDDKLEKKWNEIIQVPTSIPLSNSVPKTQTDKKPAVTQVLEKSDIPKANTAKDKPYIDSAQCTACDECITINRNIFAYNGNKQAYIKNATGGPYRDIVKAAEKCSVGIIHPGLPHDKTEKDLDKLMKRAEKYM